MKFLIGLTLTVLSSMTLFAQEMAKDANMYYREGWAQFGNGNYKEAVATLDKVIAMDGEHIAGYLCRAKAKHKLNDYDGAIKDYNQAIKLMPSLKEDFQSFIATAQKKQDYENAQKPEPNPIHETEAETVVPELANKICALIKMWESKEEKVRDDASKELEKIGAPAVPFLKKALEEALAKMDTEKQKRAEALLSDKRRKAEEFFESGSARFYKSDFDGAIQDLTKAIEFDPKYAKAYYNRGHARGKKGDSDGAIQDCTKAIELDPKYAPAYHGRGWARALQGDWDGAIKDSTKAIELDPQHSYAYHNRGVARGRKGDSDGAISDFTKAIEIDPKYTNAYNNRGLARYNKGDYKGAIKDLTKAIELDPSRKGVIEPYIEKAHENLK